MDAVADFRMKEHDGHFQVNAKSEQAHKRCHHVSQFSRSAELCQRRGQEAVFIYQSHFGMPNLIPS